VPLVGFIIRNYHGARSPESQIEVIFLQWNRIEVCRVIFPSANFEKAILCTASSYTFRACRIQTEVTSHFRETN